MTTLPTNRADREAGNVARADASEGMQAFKERQAARFRALEALDSEAKALAEKVKQMKKTNKGNRYIGDALSRAEEKARRAVGSVGVAINDLKNGNAYRFEEMKSGAESAIREAAAAVAGAAGMRQDEAAPSLNAVIDSMSEQLNSIGQAAKGIVERFAPARADGPLDYAKEGLRNMASRAVTAENDFVAQIMRAGEMNESQARKAFAKLKEVKALNFKDAHVNGVIKVKHGGFWDKAVLRRAAGLEE